MNLNQILINSIETIKNEKKKKKILSVEEKNNINPKNKELKNLEYQLNLYNKNKNKHKEDVQKINLTEVDSNTTLEDIDNYLSESKNKNKKTLTMTEKWKLIKNFLDDKKISNFKIYKLAFLNKTLKIIYDKEGNIQNLEL